MLLKAGDDKSSRSGRRGGGAQVGRCGEAGRQAEAEQNVRQRKAEAHSASIIVSPSTVRKRERE